MLLRKVLMPAVLTISLPAAAAARYMPPPLYDLVGFSDLIVVGTISRVEADTFFLEVEEVLRGAAAAIIEIERFRDWRCSRRWGDNWSDEPLRGEQLQTLPTALGNLVPVDLLRGPREAF